ncbi:hypothetical protein V491_07790 [Pseudogymnoascus sp. VKM F-3775]|nr:hypothetical protein V491_07790 [Pseudogymnoascus sp. VKM F-3775]
MDMDMSMDMDMDIMPTTTEECYAANAPWLQTMAYCIQQNCNADRYSAEKQAKCFSNQAVGGASEPTFEDSLPASAPTVELSEDAMWLNSTSLVNKNTYSSIFGTLKKFTRQEYMHTRYSPWYMCWLWHSGADHMSLPWISDKTTLLNSLGQAPTAHIPPGSTWVPAFRASSWKHGVSDLASLDGAGSCAAGCCAFVVYTLAYFEPGYGGAADYAVEAAMPFYWWGIIATIALCLAAGFAILPIRIRYYEFFLVTHIIFVIVALLYIAFAFWAADRIARLHRVAYYNRLGGSKAIIELIQGCDIMQVTVFPRASWDFGPGQHSFLYLGGLGKFRESHPFSISGWRGKSVPTTVSASTSLSSPVAHSDSAANAEEEKGPGAVSLGSQPNSTTTVLET